MDTANNSNFQERYVKFFEPLKLKLKSVARYSLIAGLLFLIAFLFRPHLFAANGRAGVAVETTRIENAAVNLPSIFEAPCDTPLGGLNNAPQLKVGSGLPSTALPAAAAALPAAAIAAPFIAPESASAGVETGGTPPVSTGSIDKSQPLSPCEVLIQLNSRFGCGDKWLVSAWKAH